MPIYEYICHNCGREQEHLVGLNADDPSCKHCTGHTLIRSFSVFSINTGPVQGRMDSCAHAVGESCGNGLRGEGCSTGICRRL